MNSRHNNRGTGGKEDEKETANINQIKHRWHFKRFAGNRHTHPPTMANISRTLNFRHIKGRTKEVLYVRDTISNTCYDVLARHSIFVFTPTIDSNAELSRVKALLLRHSSGKAIWDVTDWIPIPVHKARVG